MSTLRQAWKTVSEGTSRTIKWVAGGMRSSSKDEAPPAPGLAPVQLAASAEKTYGERLADRLGHSRRTIGLAIGIALIVLMWIGWTAYVWAENGSTAGIGVLISWPAVLAGVTLVTAPFIGGAVAVRRHRAGEPLLAGVAAVPEARPEPAPKATAEAAASEEEPGDEEPDAEEESEAKDEDESGPDGDASEDDEDPGDEDDSRDEDDSKDEDSGDDDDSEDESDDSDEQSA